MARYCALTVRQLKPGSYDEWRQAWWSDAEADDMPEGGEIYIVRNLQNPDEIVAFGLFEGDLEKLREMMDPEEEKKRHDAMAPHVESVGADGMYEVIEHIGAKTGAEA